MFDYFHKRCDKPPFFFTCSTSACICLFSSPFPICFVFPQSVSTIHWSFFGCLFVRFYVLMGILMLVYDSRNTVSTITLVSKAVFLLSERNELINVMCNTFSSTSVLENILAFVLQHLLPVCTIPFLCPHFRLNAVRLPAIQNAGSRIENCD
jgi:hypothetical protein